MQQLIYEFGRPDQLSSRPIVGIPGGIAPGLRVARDTGRRI